MAEHNLGYADLLRGDLVSALRHMDAVRPMLAAAQPGRGRDLQPGPGRGADGGRADPQWPGRAGRGGSDVRPAPPAPTPRRGRADDRARGPAARPGARPSPRPAPPGSVRPRRSARSAAEGRGAGARRRGPARPAPAVDDHARRRARGGAGRARPPRGGPSTSASTRRSSYSGAETTRRRGAGCAAIKVPADRAARRTTADRDVRAGPGRADRPAGGALGHLRAGLGELHDWQSSFGSLDLQTMVTGHGIRLAVRGLRVAVRRVPPRCCSSGRSGPGRWPAGCSRCGSRPMRRPRQTWPSSAGWPPRRTRPVRRLPVRPSCDRRCASARGSAAAPVRTPTRPLSPPCSSDWAPAAPWWPTSSRRYRVVSLVVTDVDATTHDLGPGRRSTRSSEACFPTSTWRPPSCRTCSP